MLLLLLLACQPRDAAQAGDHERLSVDASAHVPNVRTLRWSGAPGEVFVEYGLDGALDQVTPTQWSEDGEAEVPLLGLKAGRSYSAVAVTLDEAGERHESAVLSLDVVLPPSDMPSLSAESLAEDLEPGLVLTTVAQPDRSYLLMFDRDGDVVWWVPFDEDTVVSSTAISQDRRRVLALAGDKAQTENIGAIYDIAIDGSSLAETFVERAHHDFMELPDGQLAWLSVAEREVEVDGHVVNVISDEVRALRPSGESEVLFNVFEDYPVDPWRPCHHFDESVYNIDGHDWTHSNSLIPGPEGTAYLGMRNLDALLQIDLETSTLLWQLGGRDSDFTLVGQGLPWTHGHLSQVWEGGLMMFDNGPDTPESISRVVEYSVDVEARTYTQVWSHEVPTREHIEFFGDVVKLDEDRALVSWSTAGILEEIGYDHETRWEVQLPLGVVFGRVEWVGDIYAP